MSVKHRGALLTHSLYHSDSDIFFRLANRFVRKEIVKEMDQIIIRINYIPTATQPAFEVANDQILSPILIVLIGDRKSSTTLQTLTV